MARTKTSRKRDSDLYVVSKVIIAPEGVCTEVDYFNGIVNYFTEYKKNVSKRFEQLIDLCVIKRGETEDTKEDKDFAIGCSSPESVVNYASEYIKEHHPEVDKGHDKVFVLVDKDRWQDKNLSTASTLCRQKGYDLIVSNPAFEVWLLLHFVDISSLPTDEIELIKNNEKLNPKQPESYLKLKLKEHIDGFSYTSIKSQDFLPKINVAVENANKLDTPETGWEGGPFTQMNRVIKILPSVHLV
ncbi:RloB family protein [Vibrio parahaemolyticus]|uniref:RloB family protein n=1 Tax=Vibrio parahaemolyticus TaxID=670 RepID=UPI00235E6950|nr:RloB family protein [Vibrio parahaemolyticus]EGQ9220379.1 RloB domain-containing protein [Vibrio parahaemolyticus]